MKILTSILILITGLNVFAQNDSCYCFDGVDDRITIPDNAAHSFDTTDFTIEAFVSADQFQNDPFPTIAGKRDPGSGSGFFFHLHTFSTNFGEPALGIEHINYVPGPYVPDVRDNDCHHIAIVRLDESSRPDQDSLLYFIDGQYFTSSYTILTKNHVTSTNPMAIGTLLDAVSVTSFKGCIKDFRLWSEARTAEQINFYYDKQLKDSIQNLVAYYKMDEDNGQTILDYSSTAENGILGTNTSSDTLVEPEFTSKSCMKNFKIELAITANQTVACNYDTIYLNASGDLSYVWENLTDGIDTFSTEANLKLVLDKTTTYVLHGESEYSDTITITVQSQFNCTPELIVYNYVSPDGDGRNDYFTIDNIHMYPSNQLQIIDGNGNKIKEFTSYYNDWSPTDLEPGIYFYILEPGPGFDPMKGSLLIQK